MTFRLKYMFCLILVVGVALTWGVWYSALESPSANQLLSAKRRSEQIPAQLETLGAAEYLGLGEWERFVSSGGRYLEASQYNNVVFEVDVAWLPELGYEVFSYEADQTKCEVYWTADWTVVEDRARDENRAFNRQVIVSILSLLALIWMIWPPRRTQSNT